MAEPVLLCRGLTKSFGERLAVDGVGFTISEGECYGLLGPNGAGKTTTISMICGLLDRDAGEVEVAGQAVTVTATAVRAEIGFVPQEIALYPDLTAHENLWLFGRLYGLAKPALETRIGDVLELVGLADRARDRISTYSGGMKRRANLAAGLLHDPKLLVLDEPTVGVDPQSRNSLLETVAALAREGRAVLYTTHYMEEAERLCDRVGIIDAGRLVAEGTRRELVGQVGELDRLQISATGDVVALADQCRNLPTVQEATIVDGAVHLLATGGRQLLRSVIEAADRAGADVASVELVEPDLETVFLHLTGKALRD
ncbi:MAG: linearmycin/streptolysin transport system ATP-binding protein [Actinomycetota bacterium]